MLHSFIAEYEELKPTIKYSIPFYVQNKPICYINPQKPIGVEVVFWKAKEMSIGSVLDYKKRKWFGGVTYRTVNDIDFELLDKLIREGIVLDKK